MTVRVAIVGAGGFVGAKLTTALAASEYEVVAIGRTESALPSGPSITRTAADVADRSTMARTLRGCTAAYYLVHSMGGTEDFEDKDLKLARAFAAACAEAAVERIVYLGGLGSDPTSRHLRSRQAVGRALGAGGIPVVELRAAVVLGAGSASYEMLRQLVERLPAMVCPRWVSTRLQPVALADVLRSLVVALSVEPGIYGIGTPEVVTYIELMDAYARARGLRRRLVVNVPLLTLRLSSYWVDLCTSVDHRVSHSLIESLSSEVVVHDPDRTERAFGFRTLSLEDALRKALDDEAAEVASRLLHQPATPTSGPVAVMAEAVPMDDADPEALRQDLHAVGGALAWYGAPLAWRVRLLAGRVLGEGPRALVRPAALARGAVVDWWQVDDVTPDGIVLRARGWRVGDAWLGFAVDDDAGVLRMVAAFRPRGVPGLLYWAALRPFHRRVFRRMAAHRVERARRDAAATPLQR